MSKIKKKSLKKIGKTRKNFSEAQKMANIFDYIKWRGDIPFEVEGINKIDGLIFAQLSYIVFDDVISEDFKECKNFTQVVKDFKATPDFKDRLNLGFLINERTPEFLFASSKTERFKNVEVCGYRTIFSEENVEQFAAVSFLVGDKVIVAYRGTDDTVIGFEEDFNIAFMEEIPAQKHALEYFNNVVEAFPKKNIILVGHSKGGNLAVNTAVKCSKKLKKRIEAVYNFDGPGFNMDFFTTEDYKDVESKIFSFYPYLSVVGMLFHHPEHYEVIESSNFAIMQHDALSWQVSGNSFVNKSDFSDECKFFYKTFNNWIDKVSLEKRKSFVTSLFSIIKASGYKTNLEIEKNALQSSGRIITAYSQLDKESKEDFKDMFSLLFNTVKDELPVFKLNKGSNSLKLQKKFAK